ncbi:hypothetical protein [Bradyrhizobium sediminis]|uniref:hypothetical protein n=1 Tax=Bradyrhizobium sediminis TaxID=2840469 RepID=UPI00201C0E22|nr:hypothetical protein [Bradyrhizobium sediminis]
MRLFFIVWALAISLVASWAFAPAAPPPQMQILEVNCGKAFDSNEYIMVEGRSKQRQDAFRALQLPWGDRCAGEGRKEFIGGLGHYYYHRQNQTERYPETYGQLGADYIAKQWSTTDDRRIDRLTQDAYARGYLKPADFEAVAGKMVATVVKNERVTGKACAG